LRVTKYIFNKYGVKVWTGQEEVQWHSYMITVRNILTTCIKKMEGFLNSATASFSHSVGQFDSAQRSYEDISHTLYQDI
jgi:hypothetical protein